MANHPVTLDRTFRALSDPTRRAVLAALAERGPSSVKDLAEPFSIGLPTFLKHLHVLEDSGLVTTTKNGRTRSCRLLGQPLGEAEMWLAKRRESIEDQLDAFVAHVESIQGTAETPDERT